jgi:hypothetical protein
MSSERYRGVSDDEWCPDCGESLPCQCDDYYDESEDADEWLGEAEAA